MIFIFLEFDRSVPFPELEFLSALHEELFRILVGQCRVELNRLEVNEQVY